MREIAIKFSILLICYLGVTPTFNSEEGIVLNAITEAVAAACPDQEIYFLGIETRNKLEASGGSGGVIPHFKRVYYQVCVDRDNSCCPMDLEHVDSVTPI
jgi:hypothetical protein